MNESKLIADMRTLRSAMELSGKLFAQKINQSSNGKIDQSDESYGTAHNAAYIGDVHFIIPFLREGGAPSYSNSDGDTLLHFAADGWQYLMVELLILHGANVNAQNNNGDTPLHAITRSRTVPLDGQFLENIKPSVYRQSTFRELYLGGADIEIQNVQGVNPVHLAAYAGDFDALVNLLTSQRDIIDVKASNGSTALAMAILNEHIDCVKLLLEMGADSKIKLEASGVRAFTPLDLLYSSENPDLRALYDYKPNAK